MDTNLFSRFDLKDIGRFVNTDVERVCGEQDHSGNINYECLYEADVNGKNEMLMIVIDADYSLPQYEPQYIDNWVHGYSCTREFEFTFTISRAYHIDSDGNEHELTEEQLRVLIEYV